jgi:hypothetical protein
VIYMSADSVRISIDLPCDLHRRLHEAAVRKGVSARKLILGGIERELAGGKEVRPQLRLNPDSSPIRPAGRHIDLTNEESYELIEFP